MRPLEVKDLTDVIQLVGGRGRDRIQLPGPALMKLHKVTTTWKHLLQEPELLQVLQAPLPSRL